MNYTFEGTVKLVDKVQEFESGFKKREIIVSSLDEKYPQDIKFEFLKDSIDKLEGLKSGDQIKVSFNLRGNEYNGKFFNNLVGFNISKVKQGATTETITSQKATTIPHNATLEAPADVSDDLPF